MPPNRTDRVARAGDAWRPRFHITGERNWINDPNGLVHWDGIYHVFFQANPQAPVWGPPRWGHVSSPDLVDWRRHPLALVPEPGGPDADGCWSGCLRVVDGQPALYYTGVVGADDANRVESVCRAWGSTDLTTWRKDRANPLVAGPPADHATGYHRDPFLWRDGDLHRMLIGSGSGGSDAHGQVLRYDSTDGGGWTYRGVFFEAPRRLEGMNLGQNWECPQLLVDGDRAALIVSCSDFSAEHPLMYVVWFVGKLVDGRFTGSYGGRLDHGDVFYAPAVTTDDLGRTLVWGWVQERLPADVQASVGHAGALSLPRVLRFDGHGLTTAPAPELAGLRVAEVEPDELGEQLELSVTVEGGEGRAGWQLRDGDAGLDVYVEADHVVVERRGAARLRAPLTSARPVTLRVVRDGSLLEVFAAGVSLTTRWYATSVGPAGVRPVASGGARTRDRRAWLLRDDAIA